MTGGVRWSTYRGGESLLSLVLEALRRGILRGTALGENAASVLGFAQGALAVEARADDVFIASYPRSGTTWLQFILYQLTTDGEMDFEHISEVSPWYERSLATGHRTAADYNALAGPRLFKTHCLPRWLPRSGRLIYVERDCADVLESYHNFYRSHLGFDGSFSSFFDRFVTGDLQYRSWFEHVAAWRAWAERCEVLFVSFESLEGQLESQVERIAEFCGIRLDDRKRERVVQRCSFEFMKAHEDKFDHITAVLLERGYRRRAFIRRGRSGSGRDRLSDSQRSRLEEVRRRMAPARLPERHLAEFLH